MLSNVRHVVVKLKVAPSLSHSVAMSKVMSESLNEGFAQRERVSFWGVKCLFVFRSKKSSWMTLYYRADNTQVSNRVSVKKLVVVAIV